MGSIFAYFGQRSRLRRLAEKDPIKAYGAIQKRLMGDEDSTHQKEKAIQIALNTFPIIALSDKIRNGVKIANDILKLVAPKLNGKFADFSGLYGHTSESTAVFISDFTLGPELYDLAIKVGDNDPRFCLFCLDKPATAEEILRHKPIRHSGCTGKIYEDFVASALAQFSTPCPVNLASMFRARLSGNYFRSMQCSLP